MKISRKRGGWYAEDDLNGWSGPWSTWEAAYAAAQGNFQLANKLEWNPKMDGVE